MSTMAAKADAWRETELSGLAERIFAEVAALSPDVEGVSRPAFSPIETKVLDYLADLAREVGLQTWTDAGANLIIAAGDDDRRHVPFGLVGSHVDSVPQGGNFDGLAGVVTGLLTLLALQRDGISLPVPVRVLALRGEESAWFGRAYMGSQALLGRLGREALQSVHRDGDLTLAEAMAAVGIDVDRVAAGEPLLDPADVKFFLELHIEQGPILVERGWPVAAVTGIRGNIRHRHIECRGEAGHSGTVPRWLRRDAVFATAELITRMDEHWTTILSHGGDLVLTCGIMHTDRDRNAMSRIPGEVAFSFEARSQDLPTIRAVGSLLHSECHGIRRDRGVEFVFDAPVYAEPAELDEGIVEAIKRACLAENLPAEAIPSGAGHDAAVFAQAGVPTGMLFVRNEHGSHNPREEMQLSDLMAAVAVMRRVAEDLANG